MHLFSGSLVFGAVIIRVLLGLVAQTESPFALGNPMTSTRVWMESFKSKNKVRNPLFSWVAVALLGTIGLAAATGWVADFSHFAEDVHEGVAEFTLFIIIAHLILVFYKYTKMHLSVLVRQYSANILPS